VWICIVRLEEEMSDVLTCPSATTKTIMQARDNAASRATIPRRLFTGSPPSCAYACVSP
jgi:hypothetical protein